MNRHLPVSTPSKWITVLALATAVGCGTNTTTTNLDPANPTAKPSSKNAETPKSPKLLPKIATLHQADHLLSHPDDPNRMAAGVTIEKIIPRVATPVVEQALIDNPDTPRFYYLLGRVKEAAGDHESAIKAYHEAAKRNYAMAFYRLGTIYGEGTLVEQDLAKAKTFLQQAVGHQIVAAQKELQQYVFVADGFSNADLFQAIYDKTLSKGMIDDSTLRGVAMQFLEPFFQDKEIPDPISRTSYVRLAQGAQIQMLGQMFGGLARSRKNNPVRGAGNNFEAGLQEGQAMTQSLVAVAERGRADATLFYQRYGVRSPVAKQFFGNLECYINRLDNASFKNSLEKSFTR